MAGSINRKKRIEEKECSPDLLVRDIHIYAQTVSRIRKNIYQRIKFQEKENQKIIKKQYKDYLNFEINHREENVIKKNRKKNFESYESN